MWLLLDWFFTVFHGCLVVFNLTGWAWHRVRRLHLITISLTLGSWFVLGIFFGWGYCPCTDWHWQVKRQLGERNLPASYLKYFADRLTGSDWNPVLIDATAVVLSVLAFALSGALNWRDHRRRRRRSGESAG